MLKRSLLNVIRPEYLIGVPPFFVSPRAVLMMPVIGLAVLPRRLVFTVITLQLLALLLP
jgi:hypothetical protein